MSSPFQGPGVTAPVLLAACISVALSAFVITPARAQSTAVPVGAANAAYTFNIPAQPLIEALRLYTRQSGIQVAFSSADGAGRTSTAVQGELGRDAALRQLLQGTGLMARTTGGNAVMLEKLPDTADGVLTTGALSVEGETPAMAGDPGVTEGSASYTTRSMNSATRLDLSQRETPQSTTVITRQRMDDQAIDSITDVVQATPGMYMSSGDGEGRPLFYSRGFYLNNITYDGANTGWSSYKPSAVADMAMYDRVEVVRGSTGMMQGNSNPGGSINLVRKRPTDEFQGIITANTGRWDNNGTMVDFGGPLNAAGTLRGRIVGSYRSGDGFRSTDSHSNDVFYGILDADVSDSTLVEVGAYRQKQRTYGTWWGGLPLAADGQHMDLPRTATVASDWEHLYQTAKGAFLKVDQDLGDDWKLKLSADKVWQSVDMLGTELWARSAGWNLSPYSWAGEQQTNTSNYELTLDGKYSLFGRSHELVVGVTRNQSDQTDYGMSGDGYLDGIVDARTFDASRFARPDVYRNGDNQVNKTTLDSVYATTRIELADPLHLILGGRLDWYDYNADEKSSDYSFSHHVTRYAGLTYDIGEHHSLYASYTDIFKAQNDVDRNGHLLMPIVGDTTEAGIKGEYFDGALNASAAVFHTEQKNRARVVQDSSQCKMSTDCYEASGLVRSRGVELELQGALTPSWQVGAGYSFTDVTYLKDDTYARGTPFASYLPRHTFKLTTTYRLPGSLDRFHVGGNLSWQSSMYEDVEDSSAGDVRNRQGGYAVVDLIAGFRASAHWDFQVNVNNLFNRTYYQTLGSYTRYSYEVFGEPRNARLTARYTF